MSNPSTTTMPLTKPLTLIAATTKNLGIGRNGSLPWPMLKGEMGYFSRVTKRVPSTDQMGSQKINAVIMGRKTYDSIPAKFRPLKGRANVVVSSSLSSLLSSEQPTAEGKEGTTLDIASSFPAAVSLLQSRELVARVLVIGGSSVYEEALRHRDTERVLLTKVLSPEYECDTFFPVDVENAEGWRRGSEGEWAEWTGESLGEDGGLRRREGEVEYEFCLFERVRG